MMRPLERVILDLEAELHERRRQHIALVAEITRLEHQRNTAAELLERDDRGGDECESTGTS